MAIEDPREFTDHLYMLHPLLYDANGMPTDEETSYAWACVKYARDVTPKQPRQTYVQRAQVAFRDRWLVAPRRRGQDPAQSPFWPRDHDFAQGYQADLPWLPDKEFQRQTDWSIFIAQKFIREAKAEMRAKSYSLYWNQHRYSSRTSQESNIPMLNQLNLTLLQPSVSQRAPCHASSIYRSSMHEMSTYELPPLQIRDRLEPGADARELCRQSSLPSVQYILHYRP